MTREEIIERFWQKAEPLVFMAREDFVRSFEGWEIKTVWLGGQVAFAAAVKGPEFHFQSFDTGKPLPPSAIRSFLQEIIDRHGYAQTRTPHEDTRQQRFNLAFGFKEVGRDQFDIIYRIERLRHA